MSDTAIIKFNRSELFDKMQLARQAAGILLEKEKVGEDPINSLYPLALALLEAAATYEFLDSKHHDKYMNRLLNLVEGKEPDLYTRLSFVRDQCNSSEFALVKRFPQEENEDESKYYQDNDVVSVGIESWIELIKEYIDINDEEMLMETTMLIDDILWSILSISRHIVFARQRNLEISWTDIHADTSHIQSHFDLTGDYLMDIMLISSGQYEDIEKKIEGWVDDEL